VTQRFSFYKHEPIHNQISAKAFIQSFPPKGNRYRLLSFNGKNLPAQYVGKEHLINRLQKPRICFFVLIKGILNNSFRKKNFLRYILLAILETLARVILSRFFYALALASFPGKGCLSEIAG
jgi:hypothetical protein